MRSRQRTGVKWRNCVSNGDQQAFRDSTNDSWLQSGTRNNCRLDAFCNFRRVDARWENPDILVNTIPDLYLPFPTTSSSEKTTQVLLHSTFFAHFQSLQEYLGGDIEQTLLKPSDPRYPQEFYEVPSLRKNTNEFYTLGYLRGLRLVRASKKTPTSTPIDWFTAQAGVTYAYNGEKCSTTDIWREGGEFVVGICDEIQVLSVAMVQLLRNFVRASGGIAVMIGGTGSSSDMIMKADSNSNNKISRVVLPQPFPWCYLITKLCEIHTKDPWVFLM